MTIRPFHVAFAVNDLEKARAFYGDVLGASIGRTAEKWIDFNLFGHQLTAHLKPEEVSFSAANGVDGKSVPVRHFGVILAWDDWQALAEKLKARGTDFVIEPYVRFAGEVGEQATMFFYDPSGNALEFKAFKDDTQIFAS